MRPFLFLLALVSLGYTANAQAKPKTTPASSMPELPKLISTMGLPYNVVSDSVVVIPYGGEHLEDFKVVVQKIGGLFIIYTNLSTSLPGKLDESKYKYLLEKNDLYDLVKIGLADNEFYLRADVYREGITSPTLKRLITQVANVTNIIAGELK